MDYLPEEMLDDYERPKKGVLLDLGAGIMENPAHAGLFPSCGATARTDSRAPCARWAVPRGVRPDTPQPNMSRPGSCI